MQCDSTAADRIASRAQLLATHAVDLAHGGEPWLDPGEEREQRTRQVELAATHLRSLSDAMLGASEQLFVDYIDWARVSASTEP